MRRRLLRLIGLLVMGWWIQTLGGDLIDGPYRSSVTCGRQARAMRQAGYDVLTWCTWRT